MASMTNHVEEVGIGWQKIRELYVYIANDGAAA